MTDLFGDTTIRGARLSDDGVYRYSLYRAWDHLAPQVLWVLLNPSTADAAAEDATTRRLAAFTRAWGFGGYTLVNLFAFRATDPADMRRAADPVGPDNDNVILSKALDVRVKRVVAAWGVNGGHRGRDKAVLALLGRPGVKVDALKVTKDGYPQHPLYLKSDAVPTPYPE